MSSITIYDVQKLAKPQRLGEGVQSNGVQFVLAGSVDYGLDKSIVNAIRRTLLNDIPTVAFEVVDEGVGSGDLTIVTNRSVLHNEMVLHRFSLIPLYIDPESYTKQYFFECKVKHESPDPFRFITANDMNIYPLRKHIAERVDRLHDEGVESDPQEEEALHTLLDTHSPDNYDLLKPMTQKDKNAILRPYDFRGKSHYSLIHELKHTGTEHTFQELHIFGSPSVGTAKHHSRYQAVSQAAYSFVKDEDMIQHTLEDRLKRENVSEEAKDKYTRRFMLAESERYFKRDKYNEPTQYLFKLKSTHFWTAERLFHKACNILMDGCDDIKVGLLALLKESPTTITLVQPSELQFAITMNQQGHTLGNALQGHITRRSIEKDGIILTCGYKQPHPLEESIVFYLSLNPNHKISKETELHQKQSVITFLMEQLDELKALFKTILECAQKTL